MKRSSKYVGLDVHQATTVSTVSDESDRLLARTVVPTDAAALTAYVRWMCGPVHVAFEEGTQAQWLHDPLVPVVHQVVVCNRRDQSQQGNKGDQPYTDELSDLLRPGCGGVYRGGPDRATLKELARTYPNLVEDGIRVMLRLKALFRARGIRTSGRGVYQAAQRTAWLQLLSNEGVRQSNAALP